MSTYLAVFAMVTACLALVASYIAMRTLARLRRATAILERGPRSSPTHESLLEATTRHAQRTANVAEELKSLRAYVERVREAGESAERARSDQTARALRHVALVRYDAFAEMSGRTSFSLALLDERGDGVTISAITGHTGTRMYAKGVADGKGEHQLSPEESQAVSSARDKHRNPLPNRRAS
ncbi:MAG: DUF4446 family protein [Actinomycetota bacterium]|nr:DUF4446 family protein [Actinomycetota bacterium]